MNVLHVIDHLGLGGAQAALIDLVESRGPGLDATVLVLRDRDLADVGLRLARAGVSLDRVRFMPASPDGLFRLGRYLRTSHVDIVHAHLEWSCHLASAILLSRYGTRPRLVLQIDNDPRRYHPLHRRLARFFAPHVDANIVLGQSIARALNDLAETPLTNVAVIPNGIRSEAFSGARADLDEVARLRAGASVVVGAVGRLAEQKRLSLLLRAMPALLAARPHLRLLIVGDGPLRDALRKEAARLGVATAVAFTGIRRDMATVYAALDVMALPSAHEGQGLVLLEAMAARVPTVASAVVGIEDVINHETNGILVPPEDVQALVQALLRVLGDEALRLRLVGAALPDLEIRFSVEQMVTKVEQLYQELLCGPGRLC